MTSKTAEETQHRVENATYNHLLSPSLLSEVVDGSGEQAGTLKTLKLKFPKLAFALT